MAATLHEENSAICTRHQLLVIATEHRDCMHGVFKRFGAQWRDEIVHFSVTSIGHMLQELRKRDKKDDSAGPLSGGNAV